MLNNHPQLAVANDTHFAVRALEKHHPAAEASVMAHGDCPLDEGLLEAVVGYRRFRRLGVEESVARSLAASCSSYRDFVSGLYGKFAEDAGKPLGGEKTPDFVRRLPLLGGLFPDARFVHIIRDGREVALSLLDWATEKKGPGRLEHWREDAVAVAALWWRWQVSCGRDAADSLGDRYHELRYDHLVQDPEAELRRLAAFLGLPFSRAMMEFHVGRQKSGTNLSAKSAWLPATKGLRTWEALSAVDLGVFEELAGDLLRSLGYDLHAQPGEPAVAARVAAATRFFDRWSARRDEKRRRRLDSC